MTIKSKSKKASYDLYEEYSLYEELLTNIDHGLCTCSVFLDLSKAFDTVNHAILLEKLDRLFGIRGKGLDILKSYLFNRYQFTKIGNIKSTKRNIKSTNQQNKQPHVQVCPKFRLHINKSLLERENAVNYPGV